MWFLSLKQLFSRPQQTSLTLIGIMLGTAAYVMFSGIMLGFQTVMKDNLINSDGQIKISPKEDYLSKKVFEEIFFPDSQVVWIAPPSGRDDSSRLTNILGWFSKLESDSRVFAFSTQISREVIFAKGKISVPARFVGIDPQKHPKVTNLEKKLVLGKISDLSAGDALVIVGEGILRKLGARSGESISVINIYGNVLPAKIIGVFRTGNRMVDDVTVYSSVTTVQRMTGSSGEISHILVKLFQVEEASSIAAEWSYYSKDKVESWDQANASIMSIFKTQDIVRNSTTFTIILVVAFGIYNILNMVVNQKKKEIAILRSIGYTESDTILLFIYQGFLLGIIGAIAGLALGAIGCFFIQGIEIGNRSQNEGEGFKPIIDKMQISWDIMIYTKAFLLSTISSLIASYLPAKSASKLSPVEIIRGAS